MSSHTHDKMKVDLVTEGPFSWMYSVHRFDPLNPVAFFKKEADANLFGADIELLEALCRIVAFYDDDLPSDVVAQASAAIAKATRIN